MARILSRLFLALALSVPVACSAAQSTSDTKSDAPPNPHFEKLTLKEEVLSATRSRVVLNGKWQFAPSTPETDDGWGAIWVPGSWSRHWTQHHSRESLGKGPVWDGVDPEAAERMVYRREFSVPSSFADRTVELDFVRVGTDANVFIDGAQVGSVSFPGGHLDVTKFVQPNTKHELVVDVIATRDSEEMLVHMGVEPSQVHKRKSTLEHRGLLGDVSLNSFARGPRIEDTFVETSVRKSEINVSFRLSGCEGNAKRTITAVVRDRKGNEALTFEPQSVPCEEGRTHHLTQEWKNAKLWDYQEPHLYTVTVKAERDGAIDEVTTRFGFREFWVEGKQLYLNGHLFRLRPTSSHGPQSRAALKARYEGLMSQGFNLDERWPGDTYRRGSTQTLEATYDVADELGMPIAADIAHMGQFVSDKDFKGAKTKYAEFARRELLRFRNHPSVIIWVTSGNIFGHTNDQDPTWIGRKGAFDADPLWKERADKGRELLRILRDIDDSRPIVMHHGGAVGDMHSINNYMNLIPLQEREEWLSAWAKDGDMPYWAVEFGTPLHTTFHRGRNGGGWGAPGATSSEPLATEFAAIYLGAESYQGETEWYRKDIAQKHKEGQDYDNWHMHPFMQMPNIQAVEELFVRNTYRSWRAYGVSGGMNPWDMNVNQWVPTQEAHRPVRQRFSAGSTGLFRPTDSAGDLNFLREPEFRHEPAGIAFRETNQRTLAYITGAKERFTEKDKSFFAGTEAHKGLVLINDDKEQRDYTVAYEVSLGDSTLLKEEFTGALQAGEIKFIDLKFRLPPSELKKQEGRIRLTAQIGTDTHKDEFPYRVFARRTLPTKTKVQLIDPKGKTAQLLDQLELPFLLLQGERPDPRIPLIVGRQALDGSPRPDLLRFVEAGGQLLIQAQSPKALTALGFRVSPHQSRRAFPLPFRHPLTEGLDAFDFRDWNGESTLLPKEIDQDLPTTAKTPSHIPYAGWRWGGTGAVSSAAIEKPHHSGLRPILEAEFDLAYSPLFELALGKGMVTMNQLDVEDHGLADPVAREVFLRMIEQLHSSVSADSSAKTHVLGSEAEAAALRAAGLIFATTNRVPSRTGLLLVGETALAQHEKAIESYARRGGRVLVLPRSREGSAFGLSWNQTERFGGSLEVPKGEWARGISASETRRRTSGPAFLLEPGKGVSAGGQYAERRIGEGAIVFAQFDAGSLNADKLTYHRYTRWRLTRALSQVIGNLGGRFEADQSLLVPLPKTTVALSMQWKALLSARIDQATAEEEANPDPGISARATRLIAQGTIPNDADSVVVPRVWENYGGDWTMANGEAVFFKEVEIPTEWSGQDLQVHLGPIFNTDISFFNGTKIGHTDPTNSKAWWAHPRVYTIPAGLVKPGQVNLIAVRVFNDWREGGFHGNLSEMRIEPVQSSRPKLSLYHPDYRSDFELGDDPYRYYRW